MDRNELRQLVAQMLREMEDGSPSPARTGETPRSEELPDITKTDLRSQYLVDRPANSQAFLALKRKTPARVGIGHCGPRYKTQTMLRSPLQNPDHAAVPC